MKSVRSVESMEHDFIICLLGMTIDFNSTMTAIAAQVLATGPVKHPERIRDEIKNRSKEYINAIEKLEKAHIEKLESNKS